MEMMKLPRYLDAPQMFLIWRADAVLVFGAFLIVGIFTDQVTICLLLGTAISFFFSRFSSGKPEGYLIHLLYWWGLAPLRGRSIINPFHRKVLP
ncbi:MAG TPA: type IV conjugative transfer system protein TraL [Rhodanobacteraceae bacterium]|nr:type IV conjugative transfer system protein TraL [Rhodanobacteraceae bacterium]